MPKRLSQSISASGSSATNFISADNLGGKRRKPSNSSANAIPATPAEQPHQQIDPIDKETTIARIKAIVPQAPRKMEQDGNDFRFSVYMIHEDNRFYDISVENRSVYTSYGILGTTTNKKVNATELCSAYSAITLLEEKVKDKLRKGYREVPRNNRNAPNNNAGSSTIQTSADATQAPIAATITKMVKSLRPNETHYNDHLFHATLFAPENGNDWHVECQKFVNRSYSTSSKKKFKTEAGAKKFIQSKIDEYQDKGYTIYD